MTLRRSLSAALAAAALLVLSPATLAQESGAPAPAETAQEGEKKTLAPPSDVAGAIEMSESLPKASKDLDADQSAALLSAYLGLIDDQAAALEAAVSAPTGSPEHQKETKLRADLGTLLSTAEALVESYAERGIDVETARGELDMARAALAAVAEEGAGEMTRKQALALKREVLRAQLRPMTAEEVSEQLAGWLALLKEICIEVSDLEKAALESEEGSDEASLSERAVRLRGERGRLIDRVNDVISALEDKGGDVASAKAYVGSVVATPPITGYRAALSTSLAWLQSPDGGIAVGINILSAIVILFVSGFISRIVARVVRRAMKKASKTSGLLKEFVVAAVRRIIVIIGVLIALSTLGVNLTPLLAAIGAAGLVVGLALQGTLGNLASGIMIMVFRPFDVDDFVEAAGAAGKVVGLNLMTTEIRTVDNRTIHVPNNRIWGDVITNVTANRTRRVDMVFGIAYEDDAARARKIIEDILTGNDKIFEDPEPVVRLHELADSSVNFVARPWTKTSDYWDVYWEVTEAVKRELDAAGISIPYPQRQVHVVQADGASPETSISAAPAASSKTTEAQQEVAAD
ncbi:MAG: mechanosensitive ion channel domain-containing protein [Planctomycetota bacterium]